VVADIIGDSTPSGKQESTPPSIKVASSSADGWVPAACAGAVLVRLLAV
jgi:hypothetical protein